MFACKNVCLLGFAILSIRKEGRASVIICVCVYWRGTATRLGHECALRLRPGGNVPLFSLFHVQLRSYLSYPHGHEHGRKEGGRELAYLPRFPAD